MRWCVIPLPCLRDGGKSCDAADAASAGQGGVCARWRAPQRFAGKNAKKYEHLVSPITGVVRMLMPVRQDDGIAHVYMAGHNPAMKMDRLDHLKQGLRNASSGKGMSETQAKVSALCEAIERYSGELTGGELRVTRALQDWKDGEAYHPNDVMLYSPRQYAEREAWNNEGSRFNHVPEPLDGTRPSTGRRCGR